MMTQRTILIKWLQLIPKYIGTGNYVIHDFIKIYKYLSIFTECSRI